MCKHHDNFRTLSWPQKETWDFSSVANRSCLNFVLSSAGRPRLEGEFSLPDNVESMKEGESFSSFPNLGTYLAFFLLILQFYMNSIFRHLCVFWLLWIILIPLYFTVAYCGHAGKLRTFVNQIYTWFPRRIVWLFSIFLQLII